MITHNDMPPHWHTNRIQVLDFAHILTAAGVLVSATDVLDYFDQPHSYDRDHDLWTRSGHPHPASPDDLAEARTLGHTSHRAVALRQRHQAASTAWDAFTALLEETDSTGRPIRLVQRTTA